MDEKTSQLQRKMSPQRHSIRNSFRRYYYNTYYLKKAYIACHPCSIYKNIGDSVLFVRSIPLANLLNDYSVKPNTYINGKEVYIL